MQGGSALRNFVMLTMTIAFMPSVNNVIKEVPIETEDIIKAAKTAGLKAISILEQDAPEWLD